MIVVEDEPLFKELLGITLSREAGLEVVGQAEDGEGAIRLAEELLPDAVLMDIELAGKLNGIEAGISIKERHPDIGVVILSSHTAQSQLKQIPFNDSSGWGYLLKQSAPNLETVVRAIEGVIRGMVILDPAVVIGLRPRQGSPIALLSPRQQEVLELIAQGYSNAGIAERLFLKEKSVETYINGIYQTLGVSGERDVHARVQATLQYLEHSRGNPRPRPEADVRDRGDGAGRADRSRYAGHTAA
ncbi:MAG TPA: response regulator transcription factor [Candidatus Krumholzibacteria bacterium]|nr:response regulator transcription factor [Candidatus Krumholzibacteria bacterium]